MYHYKARLYSPTLGRFMQVDPIGYDDQVNLYAYVGDDPINGTGEIFKRIPQSVRDRLGMKTLQDGTIKWDWWDGGPL